MTKSEILAKLDCRQMDIRGLVNDLTVEWQLKHGDDTSRALRDVCGMLGNALSDLNDASNKVRELGDW